MKAMMRKREFPWLRDLSGEQLGELSAAIAAELEGRKRCASLVVGWDAQGGPRLKAIPDFDSAIGHVVCWNYQRSPKLKFFGLVGSLGEVLPLAEDEARAMTIGAKGGGGPMTVASDFYTLNSEREIV